MIVLHNLGVASNKNHFSFQNIRMIGMPFQTWLLDLESENDRVTCFGNRTVMNCSLFDQNLANTCQIHQNTTITCHHKFQPDECIWKSTLLCIAFRHFPDVTFIRPCLPYQTPSLGPFISDVVELQTQIRQGGVLLKGLSQSLAGDTWLEKHDEAHSTHNTANMPHSASATCCLTEKVASKKQLCTRNFFGQSSHLIFDDLEHARSYQQLTQPNRTQTACHVSSLSSLILISQVGRVTHFVISASTTSISQRWHTLILDFLKSENYKRV